MTLPYGDDDLLDTDDLEPVIDRPSYEVGAYGGVYSVRRVVVVIEPTGGRCYRWRVRHEFQDGSSEVVSGHRTRLMAEVAGYGWREALRLRWLYVKHPISWWRGRR